MKIIIIGAGEVGFHLAKKLSEKSQDVIIVDKDPIKIKRINDELDVQSFEGSGTSPELLKDAGIKNADMLIAVTDSDEVNLISCLLGRNINPLMIKIARVRNKEYIAEKELFGKDLLGVDHVINPQDETVSAIIQLLQTPAASDVIDFMDGRIKLVGIIIKKENLLCNKRLSEISFDANILIGSIIRGDNVIIPKGDSIIQEGDLVYIVLKCEQINSTLKTLGIEEETIKRVFIVGAGETGTELAF
ncbi:MAG: NAD-binding protein, partial [Leptospirales bacterium]|nr:NAD-binding protein [Leptospirales bacterium]